MNARLRRIARQEHGRQQELIAGWGVQVRHLETGRWQLPDATVFVSRELARGRAVNLRDEGWTTRLVTLTGQLTAEPAK